MNLRGIMKKPVIFEEFSLKRCICFYLKIKVTERRGDIWRNFPTTHWLTPKLATMARAGSGWSRESWTFSRSTCRWHRSRFLGMFCCFSQPINSSDKRGAARIRVSTQKWYWGDRWWLYPLCHNPDTRIQLEWCEIEIK